MIKLGLKGAEPKPISMSMKRPNGDGGTKDYNDLDNKPTINGKNVTR